MESSECVCVFTLHLKPATTTRVTRLTAWTSLHRNATVVIEARQAVMKIFEDYTQSWYWILMWVFFFLRSSFSFMPVSTNLTCCFLTLTLLALSSGLVIAMVTSLLFIILLRFLAGVMVWVMVALVILVVGYGKSSKKRQSSLSPFSLSCFALSVNHRSNLSNCEIDTSKKTRRQDSS